MNQHVKTKVYIFINDDTPIKMEKYYPDPTNITLAAFKSDTGLETSNFRFYFKSHDPEFGVAKLELTDGDAKLPLFHGQVVAHVETTNISNAIYEDIGNGDRRTNDRLPHDTCDESSVGLTTDSDNSSYFETDDDRTSCSYSNYSRGTRNTSVSQLPRGCDSHHHAHSHYGRSTTDGSIYKSLANGSARRMNESSSISSISDMTVHQEVVVQLLLTDYNFLGLSVKGQTDPDALYISNITNGSVVAKDGRIAIGDLLLQVNDTSIVGKSNLDAVNILEVAVERRGHLKLVVAKCPNIRPLTNDDAIHPIDLNAWVAHTQAMTVQEPVQDANRLMEHTSSTTSSPSFGSGFIDSDCVQLASSSRVSLDKDKTDMKLIVQQMSSAESGLDVRDREWLKIPIYKSFLGSGLVNWLQRNVSGCQGRREARKYAALLLKNELIRHPLSNKSFSEKCHYIFVEPST